MQKLKKALKKLTDFGQKAAGSKTMAAKKASPVKRKAQAVAAAKATKSTGAKKAAAAPAKKKAAVKAKAPAAKISPKAPSKATPKAAAKAAPKAAPKAAAKAAPKAAPKAAAKDLKKKPTAKAPPRDKKAVTPTAVAKAPKAAPVSEEASAKAPAVAKAPKKKEEKPRAIPAAVVAAAPQPDEEIVLTDAEGRRYCRVKDCDQVAAVDAYCRYHYLLFWKNIQNRKKILSEGKLERYIEELTARYPDKYLELLRKDLRSEKDFTAAIQELEIDDSSVENEFEDEAQSYLDEVRGISSEAGSEREEDF